MKYEKLNKNYTKIIISFIVIIIIGSVLVLNITKAKYRKTISIPIVSGTIKYEGNADLNVIAMYKPKNEYEENISEWINIEETPGIGYDIDESNTKCTIGGVEDTNKTIKISYDGETVTVTGLTKPKTKCNIYFVISSKIGDAIIANSSFIDEIPNFDKTSCAVGCDVQENGLYKTKDDFGDSYYFRGTVENNWVKFGKDENQNDIYWRIIRINGDGTIRLMYTGTNSNGLVPEPTGDQTQIESTYAFNTQFSDNMYVGYQYKRNEKRGHESPSKAYTQLIEWFRDNLSEEWQEGNGKIDKNAGFCGDRSSATGPSTSWSESEMSESGGTGSSTTYYGAYLRLVRSTNGRMPTLKCSTKDYKNEDYYTYQQATGIESILQGKIYGTQSLEYPVGLITADEVALAGGRNGTSNDGYWLFTGKIYWTMSPSSAVDASLFRVNDYGRLNWNTASITAGLRPVINLKADTTFTFEHPDQADKGTNSNPYIVS